MKRERHCRWRKNSPVDRELLGSSSVSDLRQSQRLEIMNGSNLIGSSGNRRTLMRRLSLGAAPRFLSPQLGPLPWYVFTVGKAHALRVLCPALSPKTRFGRRGRRPVQPRRLRSPRRDRYLLWGEGEPFPARSTTQRSRFSTARSSLFPLPTGEGQGEGKRREGPARISDHSRNCTSPPAKPELSQNDR